MSGSASIAIAAASSDDLDWLIVHDVNAAESWVNRCLSLGEYLMARENGAPVGFLRFSWFWGSIPFMDAIHVLPGRRGVGAGHALVTAWEAAMRAAGAQIVMTSSMSDEPEPEAWHRRQGFEESGRLTFGKAQATPEVFFVKAL